MMLDTPSTLFLVFCAEVVLLMADCMAILLFPFLPKEPEFVQPAALEVTS